MKYLMTFLMLFSISSCTNYQANTENKVHDTIYIQSECKDVDYNVSKDDWVNKVLDKKPIAKSTYVNNMFNSITYTFRYDEFEITIYYDKYVPYKRVEKWHICCNGKDGKIIFLESFMDVKEHKVSSETINRIKQMCKKY